MPGVTAMAFVEVARPVPDRAVPKEDNAQCEECKFYWEAADDEQQRIPGAVHICFVNATIEPVNIVGVRSVTP